ncbi:hypothetical protein Aau02nite_79850 [Amorphoplanes auranticolor]|uniref:Uncharacterized protein n=1 Tax=Actinoplanes auranticolor TaxID=47988 RepID=A0A919SV60_9ACTN|nr:hypothetical protein Aau02nite_79850 [Actinoplanes auranticolor]
MSLPDTGDLNADLRTVMRATVAEFADPGFESPVRALNLEIIAGPDQAKKDRLRSAQRAGHGRRPRPRARTLTSDRTRPALIRSGSRYVPLLTRDRSTTRAGG